LRHGPRPQAPRGARFRLTCWLPRRPRGRRSCRRSCR